MDKSNGPLAFMAPRVGACNGGSDASDCDLKRDEHEAEEYSQPDGESTYRFLRRKDTSNGNCDTHAAQALQKVSE